MYVSNHKCCYFYFELYKKIAITMETPIIVYPKENLTRKPPGISLHFTDNTHCKPTSVDYDA
jgi:hypothetical protein